MKFSKKCILTIYLKSGSVLTFKCANVTINKSGNDLTGISIDKCLEYFYLRLDDVSAITQKHVWSW